MTTNEITSVAIKVFAIYVLVQTIFSIPTFTAAYSTFDSIRSSQGLFWFLGIAALLILLVAAFLLWKLANQVATKVTNGNEKSNTSSIDQSFLLSLLGIYLGIDGIIRFGFVCLSAVSQTQDGRDIALATIGYIFGYIIQILVGLSLILKARGWAKFLNWLRGAGLTEKP